MKKIASFYTLVPLGLLAAPLAHAAETVDDPIVVTASRSERPLSMVGASVSLVTEADIVRQQPRDVIDILRTIPGVTFNRNGGPGALAGVSIRGAESDQTVVLIDGVKLNDPAAPGAGFNFGPLLAGNIARVEVVRGSQSVLYGSQAIGGVVNLITRAPTEQIAMFASARYGSRDTVELVGNVAGRVGPVAASLGGSYGRTDGISAFSEARGGSERDGFENVSLNTRVDIDLGSVLAVELRGYYADSRTDVDGFPAPLYALADTPDISYRQDFVGYAGLKADILDGRFRNRLGFAYTNIDRRSVDGPGADASESHAAEGVNRRWEYQGNFDATDFAELSFGAEREESRFSSASFGGTPERARTWINSLYAELHLTPIEGLSVDGGVRHDEHRSFGTATTFAANAAFTPDAGTTVLRAAFGEGFKAPSLYQLHGPYGNVQLVPEEARSWDVGVTRSLLDGRATLGVTYFQRNSRNLIDFVSCFNNPAPHCVDRPWGTYDNVARTRATGWELGLAVRPTDGFDLAVHHTQLDARNRLTGLRLARRASSKTSLSADYRSSGGLGVGMTVLMVGDSFDDAANGRRLDGYAVADIRASYAVSERVELFGRVENVFDTEYETVFRYGQLGRSIFGGVRYRI